jgi:hypothetical protein
MLEFEEMGTARSCEKNYQKIPMKLMEAKQRESGLRGERWRAR